MRSLLYLILVTTFYSEVTLNISIKFEALKPSGLKVTVPDNRFKSVSFFGILSQSSYRKEWNMDSPSPNQNLWVLHDRNIKLHLGDRIDYTINVVDRSGLRYPIRGQWIVTSFTVDEEKLDCVISKTEVPCGKKVCSGSLIFSEDFSGFDITYLTKWQFEKYYAHEPDYPFNVYLSEAVTSIREGKLQIKPMLTHNNITKGFMDKSSSLNNIYRCTGDIATEECYRTLTGYYVKPPVVTGKINTRKSFNFKYGKVEIKAQLPQGDWLIPEIHLVPRDHEYGKLHYGSGIIRIAFAKGNGEESDMLYGGPVVHDNEPLRSRFLKNVEGNNSWSDDFHTYAVVWKPDSIEMFVDGESYGIFNSRISFSDNSRPLDMTYIKLQQIAWKQGSFLAPFDKMFYISLGVRVGGIHDFPDADNKPWKNKSPKAMYEFADSKKIWYPSWSSPELLVDSVKVYAL